MLRPEPLCVRFENWPFRQSQHVSGHVAVDTDPVRHEDFIFSADTHQSLVERPVTESAQAQTVGGKVVVALAPGHNVGGLHHGMPFRGPHADHVNHLKNARQMEADQATKRCPRCGAIMILRTVGKGPNKGAKFWGCSNYPKCSATMN